MCYLRFYHKQELAKPHLCGLWYIVGVQANHNAACEGEGCVRVVQPHAKCNSSVSNTLVVLQEGVGLYSVAWQHSTWMGFC